VYCIMSIVSSGSISVLYHVNSKFWVHKCIVLYDNVICLMLDNLLMSIGLNFDLS